MKTHEAARTTTPCSSGALLGLLAILVGISACNNPNQASPDVQFVQAPGTEELNLPFSTAVRVDNTIYLSGNIGNLPGTLELAEGGIRGETRQVMENIKSALALADATMDDIVKCTVFIQNMDEWPAMNEVYVTYFDKMPARSAVGANGLALGALVEIECIAVVD